MKHFFSLLFSIFIIFLFTSISFAQDKVVLKNGETLKGELSQADWIHKREVILKVGKESKPIEASSIKELFTKSTLYIPTNNPVIVQSADNTKDYVFLELLIDGTARLLKYPSATPLHYVMTEDSLVIIDLTVFDNEFDSKKVNQYRYIYKQSLMNLFKDCDVLSFKDYNDLLFEEYFLKNFVKRYNNSCGELTYEPSGWNFSESKHLNRFRLDVLGGYSNISYTAFGASSSEFVTLLALSDRVFENRQPVVGISTSYVFNNIKFNPSIELGATYQSIATDTIGFTNISDFNVYNSLHKGSFSTSFFKFYRGINFEGILTDKFRGSLGVGLYTHYAIQVEGSISTSSFVGSQIPPDLQVSRTDDLVISSNPTALVLKGGLRYGRISATLQYERSRTGYFGYRGDVMTNITAFVGFAIFN